MPGEWGRHNREMPADSPIPGPYRPEYTPYMIPPCEAAVSFRYRGIGIVCGTQMGKTTALMNIQGEKLDNDPAPCLWIGPTKTNVQNVIEPLWDSMIRGSKSLSAKLGAGRMKTLVKRIANTIMRFAWAGSATEIAAMSAHTVVVDEVDKCEAIPGHGDVLGQAEARLSNYRASGGILVATSSPTEGSVDTTINDVTGLEHWDPGKPEDVSSRIWKVWASGTRHEFMVPCPHCKEYFSPRAKYLRGWESGDTPAAAKRKVYLLHWACGVQLFDRDKEWMLANGRAVAPGQRVVDGVVVGDAPDSEWYTIWISGLLSPWVSFGDSAYQWIAAVRSHDPDEIRTVINTRFGEMFAVRGEAPPWEAIVAISDQGLYDLGTVPSGTRYLFMSVDVQKDHLVVVVRGWGVESESWLVLREDLWGDTSEPEVWQRLGAMFDKGIDDRQFDAIAVDAGYRTDQVYTFCERRLGVAYATRGKDRPSKLYVAHDVEVTQNGKKIKRGVKQWIFDHGYFKGWVHDRLGVPQDAPGAWHLPRKIGEDYARQLVAEQRIRTASGHIIWVKTGTNDFLDAEALQSLLAHIYGVRFLPPQTVEAPPPPPPRGTRNPGAQF